MKVTLLWLILGYMLIALEIGLSNASAAKKPPQEIPLTEVGTKLLTTYTERLSALQAQVRETMPGIDKAKCEAFLKVYAGEGAVEMPVDAANRGGKSEDPHAGEAVIHAQEESLAAAGLILPDLDSFLASDHLDAQLIRCAVIADATPHGLAEFAQQGSQQQALIDKLLADDNLMKQMLEAGGANEGKYGQAMQIYSAIQLASNRAGAGIFQRLALGTSLELAVPVPDCDHPNTNIDPVKRYLHYEKACLAGELDPAFKHMQTWECRLITNSNAPDEQLAWGREMLRNYRPDLIFEPDYRWRYVASVRTEVGYKHPDPDVASLGAYQNFISGGGECGRRAFFGRYILRSFGIPTWGVTQHAHAALSHWTPGGWTVNFGAEWKYNWWNDRPGPDFLLETEARKYPKDYLKVLRAKWMGDALGEQKFDPMRPGTGGLWNALALYEEKTIVAAAKPMPVALAGQDLAEANISTQAEVISKARITAADKKTTVTQNGVITIPAVACSKPLNNTAKIKFMKSFSGGMQLHYSRLGAAETFEYSFETSEAGDYTLTAQVATVNIAQQPLMLAPNDTQTPISIALPYTKGRWEQTAPVQVTLVKGKNVLSFTRSSPNNGLSIKEFVLTPAK